MEKDVADLLNRAAAAQLHDHRTLQASLQRDEMFSFWMTDRQMLTNLIAELANKLREHAS